MACEAVLDTSSDITAYQDAGFAQSGKIFVDKVIAPRPLSPSGARKEMSFPTLLAYEHGMGLARSQSGEFEQFREITRGESVEGIDVHKSASREGYVRRVTKERVSVPVAFHVDLDWLAGTHNDHISDEPHENMIKLLRYIHKAVDEGLKPTLSVYYHGTRMRSFTGDQLAGAFKRPLRKNEGDRELFGEDIMRDLWQLSLKANLVLHNFWEVKTMPSHSMAEDEVIEPVKDGILFLAVSDELREQTVKKFGNLSSRLGCKIVKL